MGLRYFAVRKMHYPYRIGLDDCSLYGFSELAVRDLGPPYVDPLADDFLM